MAFIQMQAQLSSDHGEQRLIYSCENNYHTTVVSTASILMEKQLSYDHS